MTARNPYGNGPQSKGESIAWIVSAAVVLLGLISLKVTGWIGWVVLIGLVPFPALFGFVGIVGVAVYSDQGRGY